MGMSKAFTAVYTLMGSDGNIIGQWFAQSESADDLRPILQRVKDRFDEYGYNVLALYTDNCCNSDRSLFASVWEEFNGDGNSRHVKLVRKLKDICMEDLNCGEPEYITDAARCDFVCSMILEEVHKGTISAVGADIEYTPHCMVPDDKPEEGGIAVIQIAVDETETVRGTYVLHLSKIGKVPGALKALWESEVIKVGRAIKGDCTRVNNTLGVDGRESICDIGDLVFDFGAGWPQKLCACRIVTVCTRAKNAKRRSPDKLVANLRCKLCSNRYSC